MDQYERVISIETTKKLKDDEAELIRLRQDCASIYEQLQITIENLRAKDNQLHSLEMMLGSHEDTINSLKKEN
jgi:hypothetical protein